MKVGNAFTLSHFFPSFSLAFTLSFSLFLCIVVIFRFYRWYLWSKKVRQPISIVFKINVYTFTLDTITLKRKTSVDFFFADFMDYVQECFSVSAALIMFNN